MPARTLSYLSLYALSFLAGSYTLFSLPDLETVSQLAGLLPAFFLLVLFIRRYRLLILMFIAGYFWSGFVAANQLSKVLPQELAGENIIVDGVVQGLPVREGRIVRFNFHVIHTGRNTGRQLQGKIRVSDYRRNAIDPQPGEAWRLLLRVKPPHGFANRAGFDYEKWLFSERIIATAYIRKIQKNDDNADDLNRRLPELDQPALIDRMRLSIAAQISRSLPNSTFRGIITALATGDRRDISAQQWSVLQTTGTSHLMAISGLHVGLVAGLTFLLFRFLFAAVPGLALWVPAHQAAAVAAMLCAAFYSLMAGFSLPTQRALLMLSVLMLAVILQRRVRPLDVLSLALLAVLILDPLSLMSPGFWLSFSAVSMILYISLQTSYKSGRAGGSIFSSTIRTVNMQWRLSLMMAPATLLFFQQIPLTGPFANLVAIPVVAFLIVPLVLLASVSFFLFAGGQVGPMLLQLADTVIHVLWMWLEHLALLSADIPVPVEYSVIALAGIVFTVFMLMLPGGLKTRMLAIVGMLVFFFPLQARQNELSAGEYRMILLDVGQGLSAIIMTSRHAMVFDTGARFSKRFNAGDAVVLPVLKSLSINRLDAVIVSHGDNDHSGGLQKVLAGVDVRQVISNEQFPGVSVTACRAGLQWQWEGVSFRVLHPTAQGESSGNNGSCVLQIQSEFGSVLLPADIEKEAERDIVSRYPGSLQANILVAGHHGSNTSSGDEFITAVSPSLVLFPAGWMNRYHHPAEKVLNRLADMQIGTLSTGDCGAISVEIAAAGIVASSWRQSHRKIWHIQGIDERCSKVTIGLSETPAI